jgi:hypothetical protein
MRLSENTSSAGLALALQPPWASELRATAQQSSAIAHSIYRRLIERNAWGTAMAPAITEAVANLLAELPPRVMRTQLSQACGRAARQGRRELTADDICFSAPAKKASIGFVREAA